MPPKRRRTRRDLESVAALVERLRVRAHGLHQPVAHLSGGNQQKALLARWLLLDLAVLLLEEPTRGVDVGARADLEAVIRELGERGLAVLLSSSEVEELERVAHRAVVLYEGRQVASLRGGELTAARLLEGLAGGAGRGGS